MNYITPSDDGTYSFYCPGCKHSHGVNDRWKIDLNTNTIHPSVLVRTPRPKGEKRCHSWVRNGSIEYLGDCTHELAGKTVPMEVE
jgi:hypothetical protein